MIVFLVSGFGRQVSEMMGATSFDGLKPDR
jgi:hypothetical protein